MAPIICSIQVLNNIMVKLHYEFRKTFDSGNHADS